MVSLLALFLLWPLMLLTAVAVALVMGCPVIYSVRRPGQGGRPFTMRKFRTMTDKRSEDGELLPDSDRLTGLGRFLRATSLDELPSLWNVLKGDMSLVGPRPLLMEYLPLYTPEQARRHDVRPGITGLAQVSGRNRQSWEERFRLDVWYVEHRTFWIDIRILWRTVVNVLKRDGISHPGESTMPRFKGDLP